MIYKLKKGKHGIPLHQRLWPIWFLFKNGIGIKGSFKESCLYHIDGNDLYDINKLVGISHSINTHKQSARIGWRCLDGKNIQLLAYVYNNGKRVEEEYLIKEVKPNETFTIGLIVGKEEYNFSYLGPEKNFSIKVPKPKTNNWIYFRQYPYFGGNQPAPHDMEIQLEYL